MEQLRELREKAERATPGPWRDGGWSAGAHIHVGDRFGDKFTEIAWLRSYMLVPDDEVKANAAYLVAASPDVIIGLVDEVEALRGAARPLATLAGEINADEISQAIVLAACELQEIPDPDDDDTLTITIQDLEAVAHRHITVALERADLPSISPDYRESDRLKTALRNEFCALFLDGRNEHGSHVLPSYPRSFDANDDDMNEQAEAILQAAEAEGFVAGEDHVWAEFTWIEPQVGDFGRVELAGYWEFDRINVEMTRAVFALTKESSND